MRTYNSTNACGTEHNFIYIYKYKYAYIHKGSVCMSVIERHGKREIVWMWVECEGVSKGLSDFLITMVSDGIRGRKGDKKEVKL